MSYMIRVYMGQQIKDISLVETSELITIGSSDMDTLNVPFSDIVPNHLLFRFINGVWVCQDNVKHETKEVKDGDTFVLSMQNRVAAAIYSDDIIPQRVKIKPNNRLKILCGKQGKTPKQTKTCITLDELYEMQKEVEAVNVPDKINELMDDVLCVLRKNGIHVSDRKFFGFTPIVQAKAFLNGNKEVLPKDLLVLKNYFWNVPAEISKIEKILSDICENPFGAEINSLLSMALESVGVMEESLMAINTDNGQAENIMGKYMYYSLPNMVVKVDSVKSVCEQIGFPIEVNEKISITDAYRSATGEIYDRIEEAINGEKKVTRIYCRDNKRAESEVLSRELVEETLYESTNTYKKLANIILDKASGTITLSDVDYTSGRDIRGYFRQAEQMFELYQDCIGNRSIETMAGKYISQMNAISISARGHHYFIPKAYMHKIQLLEDFMELVGNENLYTYPNSKRDSKYISINSMYVADDEKQRKKMAHEFYLDMAREIEEYQKRIGKLIQNGNTSQKILDRWVLKIQSLEAKKRDYEMILKRDLSGIDEEFTMLRDMCNQFGMGVRSAQIWNMPMAA